MPSQDFDPANSRDLDGNTWQRDVTHTVTSEGAIVPLNQHTAPIVTSSSMRASS